MELWDHPPEKRGDFLRFCFDVRGEGLDLVREENSELRSYPAVETREVNDVVILGLDPRILVAGCAGLFAGPTADPPGILGSGPRMTPT
jgi:hypothetical protein